MINFLTNYWSCYIIAIILGVGAGIYVYYFNKKSKLEKISKLKQWLKYAVIEAENKYGSKTGEVKLRFVYDLFMNRFPTLAKILSFEMFSYYVDEALAAMEKMIDSIDEKKESESNGSDNS
jgi:hypothetical protein